MWFQATPRRRSHRRPAGSRHQGSMSQFEGHWAGRILLLVGGSAPRSSPPSPDETRPTPGEGDVLDSGHRGECPSHPDTPGSRLTQRLHRSRPSQSDT